MSSSSSSSPVYLSRTQKVQGRYGFAQVGNDLCLIQFISSPAPQVYEAHIFRHTFVSLFSYMQTSTISGKTVLQIFDNDDEQASLDPYYVPPCRLETDTGIVFVSQDVMARYVQLKDLLCPGIGFYKRNNNAQNRRPISLRCSTKTGEMSSGAAFMPFSSMVGAFTDS